MCMEEVSAAAPGILPTSSAFATGWQNIGYNTVSITYRLTRRDEPTGFGCDCPATDKLNTFRSAVEDVQDATFFLIQNRESLGIDPQQIILAGSSAGAETVLNAAYQPPYCYGLDSGPVSYAGVISMAGAIPDTFRIFPDSAVPSLLFHGTCDNLVPYASASHRYCQPKEPGYLPLFGSYPISRKLAQLGVPYWLHTTCGGAHELAGKPMDTYFNEIVEFCHDFVLQKTGESRHTIVPGDQMKCTYEHFEFCTPMTRKPQQILQRTDFRRLPSAFTDCCFFWHLPPLVTKTGIPKSGRSTARHW